MKTLMKAIVGCVLMLSLQACLNSKDGKLTEVATQPEQGPLSTFDANMYPLNKVVCDPFDPGQPGPNDGLVAELYYRGQNQPIWYTASEFVTQGQKSQQKLFFSSLNVPTRLFSMGFPSETGSAVKDDSGNPLNEYFALSFSSVLKLTADDEAGEYEFALLSDDGANMYVRDAEGVYQKIVANDGDHPTRLGCGQRLTLNHESELVVKMDYYQGPRYHIAMIPMWRKVTASTANEPRCGETGNEHWFDYNDNSKPKAAYNSLLTRGWKPIHADNWNLPAYAVFNPCTPGTTPTISNFAQTANVEGFVAFSWTTNIPTTSQLLIKNMATGEEILTTSDNRLGVNHSVARHGLTSGVTYEVRAISISADFGKAISNPITVTVQ